MKMRLQFSYQLEKNAIPLKFHDKVLVVPFKYRNSNLKLEN